MKLLASLLVGKPLHIVVVAAVFVASHLVLRATVFGAARHHPRALLVAAVGWLSYGAWEWLVQARTPEANIRVDLLIIWPVLAVVSAWAVFRSLR